MSWFSAAFYGGFLQMRVRCIKLISEQTGQPINTSPWLSVGKVYLVLEVLVSGRDYIKFRLVSDDNKTPAFHDFSQFELVSGAIPKCWIATFEPGQQFCLSPSIFAQRGFWDRYFDGDDETRRAFDEVLRTLEEDS